MCGVCDLSRTPDGAVVAAARRAPTDPTEADYAALLQGTPPELVDLGEVDLLLIRTNPGRDAKPAPAPPGR